MIFTIFVQQTKLKQHMHFVLSYDLSAEGARRQEIEQNIEQILHPYRHVKRLSTFYIIHILTNADWENIRVALTKFAQEINESFHFIMTPPIDIGNYNGLLSKGDWDEINEIVNLS